MALRDSGVRHCDKIIVLAGLTFIAGSLAMLLFELGPNIRTLQGQLEVLGLWLFGFIVFSLAKCIELKKPHERHFIAHKCLGVGYVFMACAALLEFVAF